MNFFKWALCAIYAILFGFSGWVKSADSYPVRPIRLVCPYNPGGGASIFAQSIATKLTEYLGQTVVVDNRGGANGIIGTDLVAKALPDGYTLLVGNSGPITINPNLYKEVPYNSIKNFSPITQGTIYYYILVVSPSFPAKSLNELIGILKFKPGELTYGSTGIGSGNHLAGELLNLMTNTKAIHVPYSGGAPALTSLMGGQTSFMFDTAVTSVPFVKSGRLKAIAVTSLYRSEALPEIPTMDQLGLKGYEVTQWLGILAPVNTPKIIIDKLNKNTIKALKSVDVIERIGPSAGNDLIGNSPDEFSQIIKKDLLKYGKIIKDSGIKLQ